jgi:hypothetical protein
MSLGSFSRSRVFGVQEEMTIEEKLQKIKTINCSEDVRDEFLKMAHEINRLHHYKRAIHDICSYRLKAIDDYIMLAQQAVADYEKDLGTGK